MAVFPDRIVLKSSTDPEAEIITAIQQDGDHEIVPGELVISRQDGVANIFTLDGNGAIVSASTPYISGLLDVDLTEPIANNSILVYDEPSGKWVNEVAPPYDISGNNLNDLGDVNVSASPADYEVVYWNFSNSSWESKSWGMEDLVDVNAPNAYSTGNVLRWNSEAREDADQVPIGWEITNLTYADIDGRPLALSDLTNDVLLGDLQDVNLTARPPELGDIIAWTGTYWGTVSAPPVDLTGGTFTQIGDVVEDNLVDGAVPVYNAASSEYEVKPLPYDKLSGAPTALSALTNDLSVSDFPNDAGYITATAGLSMSSLSDANPSNEQEGQTLIWRSNQWVNEFGPPANISFSSIGELSDVTYYQPGTEPGVLTVDNMGVLQLDSPQLGNGFTAELIYNQEYGIGMEMFRDSDDSGSAVYADRSRGVTLRSDVNMVRLTGRTDTTNNRPELRFETGDNGGSSSTGEYIGIKMPVEVTESITYVLPGADGEVGDVLATDGSGNLEWSTPSQLTALGNLQDVDLATLPPLNGDALIYNAAAGVWMPGEVSDVDISSISINALRDVDTSTNAPGAGQALVWSVSGQEWVPGDVSSTIIWLFTANGTSSYSFYGAGWPTAGSTGNPEIFVQRGQTYRIVNSAGGHPMQIQSTEGPGGTPYSEGIAVGGTNPIAASQEISWTIPMDAPDTLYYQCTSHSLMRGIITVGGGGGGGGQVVTDERATETQTAVAGEVTFSGIGKSGTLVSVSTDQDAWVAFYTTAAARTADASRLYDVDPTPGSGVLCEVFCQAGGTVFTTPGTVYHNNDTQEASAIYAAVRDQSGVAVAADVTVKAYPNLAGVGDGSSFVSLATLKAEVAASADFADFQSRIAAL